MASEGNIATHRRLAKPAFARTIVVHRLLRVPRRIDPPASSDTCRRRLSPELFWCSIPPGDSPHLPTEPIAAYPDRKPRTNSADGAPFVQDDSRSLLLASAWYSTSDLAAYLRVDSSTLRRWRTARPPQGPPFVAVSERVIMYSALDVEKWLHSHRTVPRREA
ncbi:helix-turn-helix transcriptional regulator [Streptomyces sp. NPDC087298]|uniref:helix-turn-helix transcriptional regulator n=1 Tax=Streptomyces sp. NPDC087298 TaxID=3365779 RepID=UPI003827E558